MPEETTLPEGITRAEFSELATAVGDLRKALDDQKEASTKAEKQEAREDVADAKADLDALAKELGISPKSLKDAAEQARREERKAELKPLLLELLDEELGDDSDDSPEDPDDKSKPEKSEAGKVKEDHAEEPTPEDGPQDTAPTKEHWSDKAVSGLFG